MVTRDRRPVKWRGTCGTASSAGQRATVGEWRPRSRPQRRRCQRHGAPLEDQAWQLAAVEALVSALLVVV